MMHMSSGLGTPCFFFFLKHWTYGPNNLLLIPFVFQKHIELGMLAGSMEPWPGYVMVEMFCIYD
jgi:hypothetical protein